MSRDGGVKGVRDMCLLADFMVEVGDALVGPVFAQCG